MSLSLKHVLAGCIAGIAVGVIIAACFLAWSGKKAGGEIPADSPARVGPASPASRPSTASNDPASVEAIESIIVPQDLPNTPVKVTPEPGDETVESVEGWKLQHLGTGLYRIVDPLGIQRASGSEQAMRKSFEVVRSQFLD